MKYNIALNCVQADIKIMQKRPTGIFDSSIVIIRSWPLEVTECIDPKRGEKLTYCYNIYIKWFY